MLVAVDDGEYLRRILTARVYDVVRETPLEAMPTLSRRLGSTVLLKREDLQPVFSFKLRGAYNKMAQLSPTQRDQGVIAASAGNHAQGVALSARVLGCQALIVMPTTTPQVKIEAVRVLGAQVVLHGQSYSDASAHAATLMREQGLTYVHPFDDPDVIAGQGTVAMEILRQHSGPLDAVFVPVGGGGLIAGSAAYLKALAPHVRVVGVETDDANAMEQSLAAGQRVVLDDVGLFADGTAVKQVGEETFRLAQRFVDEIITVNTDELCAAIKDAFTDTRSILEPAGALAIAGAKQYVQREGTRGLSLVAIGSGANMNFDRLRFVAERAEIGEAREVVFAVTIPERRGSFRRLIELVGSRPVTEFNYRMGDSSQAHIYVGMQVVDRAQGAELAETFRRAGFATLDLTEDELAKLHLRHLVGGPSALANDERVYRFEFPERPGALMRFLTALNPNWNISLFHYRNHGADYGRVLVGIQVPPADAGQFATFLHTLGYPHTEETANPAYQLFLHS